VTHAEPSLTHTEPSLTHAEPSLTHAEPSLTHAEPSLTHAEPRAIVFSPTASAPSKLPNPEPMPLPTTNCHIADLDKESYFDAFIFTPIKKYTIDNNKMDGVEFKILNPDLRDVAAGLYTAEITRDCKGIIFGMPLVPRSFILDYDQVKERQQAVGSFIEVAHEANLVAANDLRHFPEKNKRDVHVAFPFDKSTELSLKHFKKYADIEYSRELKWTITRMEYTCTIGRAVSGRVVDVLV
jgi:hypothetical protein